MLVCGLQRCNGSPLNTAGAHCPAEGCQRTLWNRLDCLVHIRLAYACTACAPASLALAPVQCWPAPLREPPSTRYSSRRHSDNRCGVIQSCRPGAKIWSQIYAHKPSTPMVTVVRPAATVWLFAVVKAGQLTAGFCSRQPVCQVHRALTVVVVTVWRAPSHPN